MNVWFTCGSLVGSNWRTLRHRPSPLFCFGEFEGRSHSQPTIIIASCPYVGGGQFGNLQFVGSTIIIRTTHEKRQCFCNQSINIWTIQSMDSGQQDIRVPEWNRGFVVVLIHILCSLYKTRHRIDCNFNYCSSSAAEWTVSLWGDSLNSMVCPLFSSLGGSCFRHNSVEHLKLTVTCPSPSFSPFLYVHSERVVCVQWRVAAATKGTEEKTTRNRECHRSGWALVVGRWTLSWRYTDDASLSLLFSGLWGSWKKRMTYSYFLPFRVVHLVFWLSMLLEVRGRIRMTRRVYLKYWSLLHEVMVIE